MNQRNIARYDKLLLYEITTDREASLNFENKTNHLYKYRTNLRIIDIFLSPKNYVEKKHANCECKVNFNENKVVSLGQR